MAIPAKKLRFWLADKLDSFLLFLIKDKENPKNPSVVYDVWMFFVSLFFLGFGQTIGLLRIDATESEKE